MGEIVDYFDRIKRYFRFTPKELRAFLIAVVAVAFIISFDQWGDVEFDFMEGMVNLLVSILVVAISFFVHDAGQRLWGLGISYRIEYRLWSIGIGLGLVIAFVSNGALWLIAPSSFIIHHLSTHRLGWFRYGINTWGQGIIALAGPLATLTFLIVLKILHGIFDLDVLAMAIKFNTIYLIISLLPIPPLDGSKLYWGSRMMYAFMMPAVISGAILLLVIESILISTALALVIAFCLWLTYYILFEQYAWKSPN